MTGVDVDFAPRAVRFGKAGVRSVPADRSGVPRKFSGTARRVQSFHRDGSGQVANEIALEQGRLTSVSLLCRQPIANRAHADVKILGVGGLFAPWEYFRVEILQSGYVLMRGNDLMMQRGVDSVVAMFSLSDVEVTTVRKNTVKVARKLSREKVMVRFATEEAAVNWAKDVARLSIVRAPSLSDFDVLGALGRGAHGNVFLIRQRKQKERLAMKVVSKKQVLASWKGFEHAMNERMVLELVRGNPFFVQLHFAFQSRENFYLLTDLVEGGDLYEYQKKMGNWKESERLRSVIVEVICALEYLHSKGIVYRDLKPENVLIHRDGHIRLTDFGLAKIMPSKPDMTVDIPLTSTFCGTGEYAAPEMLSCQNYGFGVDFYALGVFIFFLLHGKTAFAEEPNNVKYRDPENLKFSEGMTGELVNLCERLMEPAPELRIGGGRRNGFSELREHPYLQDVKWENVLEQRAPFEDFVKSNGVLSNFDMGNVSKARFDETNDDISYGDSGFWPARAPSSRGHPENFIAGYSYSGPHLSEKVN